MTAVDFSPAVDPRQSDGWLFERAPAKVNLGLRITGKRADGYHLLDSLVVFAGVGDVIAVRPTKGANAKFCLRGPFAAALGADTDDNLVTQAARAFRLTFGGPEVDIILWKHLPLAGGIGGGSADAAAVLRLLAGMQPEASSWAALANLALTLGADLPMCLLGRPTRISGIGEYMTPLSSLPTVPAVLCNPGVTCPTPTVFKARKGEFSSPGDITARVSNPKDLAEIATLFGNDLTVPAIATTPRIKDCLDAIGQAPGLLGHGMSGSGATCFGLYGSNETARTAAAAIARRHPDWWVRATRLYGT